MQQTTNLYGNAVKSTVDYAKAYFTAITTENVIRLEKILAAMVDGAATATCDPM